VTAVAIDRAKLHPLTDAHLEALALIREILARNQIDTTEQQLLAELRALNLAAVRVLLTYLHPPESTGVH
jgi:hypothetical protein